MRTNFDLDMGKMIVCSRGGLQNDRLRSWSHEDPQVLHSLQGRAMGAWFRSIF